jgi:hypothetical protein
MNDPQCPTPHHQPGVPPDLDVPDCGTGPLERVRFVARELRRAVGRHRRTTGKD